jgi:hypothetical protein
METYNTIEKFTPKYFPQSVNGFELGISEKIKNLLTNPVLTITASTTGITNNVYNLFLNEYQKNIGDFKYQLFQDYGQYFITTQFEFDVSNNDELQEFYQLGDKKNLISVDNLTIKEITPVNKHVITGGTFSGTAVYGNFFSYFLLPNKPEWEAPFVLGELFTFSPTFFWKNSNEADSYLLQIAYDNKFEPCSKTIYSYPIEKNSTNLSTNEMLNLPDGDWSVTKKTTNVVREYSVPILPNKTFWYRIGNVKELINVFGVKQRVVSFSDIQSAATSSSSYEKFIRVEVDSPHTSDTPCDVYPDYLDDVYLSKKYILSGTVSGSIVTGATMQLIFPNGNYITQQTNSIGEYYFDNLDTGIYDLNTYYRGYQQNNQTISLTADTLLSFSLKLLWGNKWDKWGDFANEHPFI